MENTTARRGGVDGEGGRRDVEAAVAAVDVAIAGWSGEQYGMPIERSARPCRCRRAVCSTGVEAVDRARTSASDASCFTSSYSGYEEQFCGRSILRQLDCFV
jgi:hypothetical protein